MLALHNAQRKRKMEHDGSLFQAVGIVSFVVFAIYCYHFNPKTS